MPLFWPSISVDFESKTNHQTILSSIQRAESYSKRPQNNLDFVSQKLNLYPNGNDLNHKNDAQIVSDYHKPNVNFKAYLVPQETAVKTRFVHFERYARLTRYAFFSRFNRRRTLTLNGPTDCIEDRGFN